MKVISIGCEPGWAKQSREQEVPFKGREFIENRAQSLMLLEWIVTKDSGVSGGDRECSEQ